LRIPEHAFSEKTKKYPERERYFEEKDLQDRAVWGRL